MSTERLVIRTLTIKHTAGFPRAGLPPMTFCDGLNIIFGPNASGKTTTARAIQTLLWPDADTQGALLTAEVAVNGVVGQYRYLGGKCEGEPKLPYLGDATQRFRYMLAQHELLSVGDDQTHFAETILREARGGLDVRQAMQELGYRAPGRSKTPTEYREATQRYREARDAERQIQRVELNLLELEGQLEAAKAAQRRLERLTQALEYLAQLRAEEQATEELVHYPPELAGLTGQELTELDGYTKEITEADTALESAIRQRAEADARRTQTGLTDPLAVDRAGAAVDALCAEIDGLDAQITAKRAEQHRAQSEAESAFANLGGPPAEGFIRSLPATVVQELGAFVRQAEGASAAQQAVAAQLRWLESVTPPQEPHAADLLREASRCLQQWLALSEDSAPPLRQTLGILAGALAAVMGLLAAVINHSPFGAVAVPCGLAVCALLLWAVRRPARSLTRAMMEERFAALHLDGLAGWTAPDVERFLAELHARLAAIELARNAQIKRHELRQHQEEADARAQGLEAEAVRLAGLLGVDHAQVRSTATGLWYFVDQLIAWQQKRAQAHSAQEELTALQAARQTRLDAANAALAPFGYAPARSSGELRNLLTLLYARRADYLRARDEEQHAATRQDEAARRKEGFTRTRSELLARLALDPDAETARRHLAALLTALADYRAAHQRVQEVTAVRKEIERKGQAWPEWSTLIAQDPAALQQEREAASALAEQLTEISQRTGDYARQVASAKEQAACEQAQAALDRVTSRLRQRLEETLRAGIGWSLATQLEAQEMDAGLPDVFQRAQALFAAFTNGRYDLRIHQPEMAFRAYDREDGVERGLDQLSSATRVQLLMAVRVAFVETREQGARLPLLMDETLACSDERREHAIITTALHLCREGRQVFYFTSKPHELAKWQQQARAAGVSMMVVTLDATLPERTITPLPARPALPDPAGMSHDAYGQALGVPQVDFRTETAARAHAWYVVDDPVRLRALLDAGLATCGQLLSPHLTTLLERLLGADTARNARAKAHLLQEMERLWWEGRGAPLHYQALQDSGILSAESFKKDIPPLAEALHWEARALLVALEGGRVKRMRSDSVQRFRAYCEEHGYLVEGEPLHPDALYERLLAAATEPIAQQIVSPADIQQLFRRVLTAVPA